MFRGTTPTYVFNLSDQTVDLTAASKVFVTFARKDGSEILTKAGDELDVSAHSVSVFLTQEETLSFPTGQVNMQLNWLYDEGGVTKRACTRIISISSAKNLKNEVLS